LLAWALGVFGCLLRVAPAAAHRLETVSQADQLQPAAPASNGGKTVLNNYFEYTSGGKAISLTAGETVFFTITKPTALQEHSLTVNQVTPDGATLTVSPDHQVLVHQAENREIDADGDGIADIAISYSDLKDNQGNFTFKQLGPPPMAAFSQELDTTPATPSTNAKQDGRRGLYFLTGGVAAAVILLAIHLLRMRRHPPA
jgi:hypothetical protein